MHHLKHAKNYHNGVDKQGRPITVMRVFDLSCVTVFSYSNAKIIL